MDVRCEKCQTEYELDEARLKPGGVTVKCTNCGHMFKIRKRTITNVGTPAVTSAGTPPPPPATVVASAGLPPLPRDVKETVRSRTDSPRPRRADSMLDDSGPSGPVGPGDADEMPTTIRQWLIRLDNGEQKSCRELATLQQWIITGVVSRESLISRTGKTWKRLGDIVDLGQYFAIADEARANRERSKASRATPAKEPPATLPGYTSAQAAGGTILPDDDSGIHPARGGKGRVGGTPPPPVPPRGAARTPPAGAPSARGAGNTPGPGGHAIGMSPTVPVPPPVGAPPAVQSPARVAARPTPPPPPPLKRPQSSPIARPVGAQPPAIPPPQDGRSTAMWASDAVKPGPTGPTTAPFIGKLSGVPDEPAFAGRVRMAPGDEATFETGKVAMLDDDDQVLPGRRGSRAGMLVLVVALLVMGAGAAAVYVFVIRRGASEQVVAPEPANGTGAVAVVSLDAAVVAPGDAQVLEPAGLAAARGELGADVESRLRTAAQSLEASADPRSQALRAHLIAQLAQGLQDRASVTADTAIADTLRREAKQLVLDAATAAQRALTAAGDDAGANIAMAEVLRLQGKPARDIARYLETARGKADAAWKRDLALADGLLLVRDGKLDDASAAFTALDQGDGKLEASGDVRARFHLALVLAAQNKPAEAKPLVESILAAQPEHAGARALAAKLETAVVKTDPLPPEEGTAKDAPAAPAPRPSPATPAPAPSSPAPPPSRPEAGGGESYDRLLARANAIADTSCARAMELYAKALEQKPNGVEALAGMGYCHIDAKQFASAFSKFRAALAVSPRYEPALRGVAEAYQQQGRKEQAIEAYRAYLDAYPDSAAAKRQLERLGGDTAPAQAAPPPPPPPSPSEPSGAGAGSG